MRLFSFQPTVPLHVSAHPVSMSFLTLPPTPAPAGLFSFLWTPLLGKGNLTSSLATLIVGLPGAHVIPHC